MEPGASTSLQIYIRASTLGVRAIMLQLDYLVGDAACQDLQTVELPVLEPFTFSTTFLSESLEDTTKAHTDEMFRRLFVHV